MRVLFVAVFAALAVLMAAAEPFDVEAGQCCQCVGYALRKGVPLNACGLAKDCIPGAGRWNATSEFKKGAWVILQPCFNDKALSYAGHIAIAQSYDAASGYLRITGANQWHCECGDGGAPYCACQSNMPSECTSDSGCSNVNTLNIRGTVPNVKCARFYSPN